MFDLRRTLCEFCVWVHKGNAYACVGGPFAGASFWWFFCVKSVVVLIFIFFQLLCSGWGGVPLAINRTLWGGEGRGRAQETRKKELPSFEFFTSLFL